MPNNMEELASILLHSQTQTHIFHLGVSGPGAYAAHKALQKYYESIDGVVDGLVESYQGKNGLIEFKAVAGIDNNCDTRNIIVYFDKLISIVKTLRQAPDLACSYLQNQIDNVEDLLYSTKYKLVNLQ
jgi:DNA-binding ferritin-like protein